MSYETKQRADIKWAHPESYEEGWYLLDMPDMVQFAKSKPGENEAMLDEMGRQMDEVLEASDMKWTEYHTSKGCPEEPDAPPVEILVGTPKDLKPDEKLPVVFCVSGGGLIYGGRTWTAATISATYCNMSGVRNIQFTFSYRIAPTYQYPAAINDCHAAYQYMIEHADELQIDTDKIVIWGTSTGGQLSLCTAFRMKRYSWCDAPMPRGVIIQVPVMDDVAFTSSSTIRFDKEDGTKGAYDADLTAAGYRAYLGDRFGDPTLPPEAVPNRATLDDVKGFPPLWIPADGEFEPGRDSLIKFAGLLMEAGIFCDLHIWGGTSHQGFTAMESDFAKRCNAAAFSS